MFEIHKIANTKKGKKGKSMMGSRKLFQGITHLQNGNDVQTTRQGKGQEEKIEKKK